MIVPTGTATFGQSFVSLIALAGTEREPVTHTLDRFEFTTDAVPYQFNLVCATLNFEGLGMFNNSAHRPRLDLADRATLVYDNTASAGNADHLLRSGSTLRLQSKTFGGFASFDLFAPDEASAVELLFLGKSDAGAATITLEGASTVVFGDQASLTVATITCKGTLIVQDGAFSQEAEIEVLPPDFEGFDATLTLRGGATLGTALVTLRGGAAFFAAGGNDPPFGSPTADQATFSMDPGSIVDISQLTSDGIGIGSLSGAGDVYLSSRTLSLGNLGGEQTITGRLLDGASDRSEGAEDSGHHDGPQAGGSLVKVGEGTVILAGDSEFSGVTEIFHGRLDINGTTFSDIVVWPGARLGGDGAIWANVELMPHNPDASDAPDRGGVAGILAGAILSPGAPIGGFTTTNDNQLWPGGTIYEVDIASALPPPKGSMDIPWDLFVVDGALQITATPEEPILIALRTVNPDGTPALLPDFDPTVPASWEVTGVIGPMFGFNADAFEIDASAFQNPIQGTFSVIGELGEVPSISIVYVPGFPIVGDLNGDGIVDGADLGLLLDQWGGRGSADLNQDGIVNDLDLTIILAAWGG